MPTDLKNQIQTALNELQSGDLSERATHLLATLGYRSKKVAPLSPQTGEELLARYDLDGKFNREKARLKDWQSADILFQLTDAEVKDSLLGQSGLDFQSAPTAIENKIIQSYVFLAIELQGQEWNRGDLAAITREVNRLFPMPAMIIFRHGDKASIGVINRRLNKKDESRDVLEKVTLIKDIRLKNPHRAHIEILHELSLPELRKSKEYRVSNFVELHNAWRGILDLTELNKRFYRELSNWYFWATQNVEFPRPKTDSRSLEEHRAMSVIRLITRLIFVWFIKERDLVPDALFEKDEVKKLLHDLAPHESTYYKAILQNLFFATLNTELGQKQRAWASEDSRHGKNPDYGIDKWRFRELFQNPESAETLFRSVPFLNGGLFRRLDNGDKGEYFDGFTRRTTFQPSVPNILFWGDDTKADDKGQLNADLNEVYGSKGRTYKVRPLLDILKSYIFTVAENTPIEEEVALDPELLGKVFENLLASYNPETATTARKQTGSFYTPRPIVEYLVEESLFAHLHQDAPEIKEADLRALLSPEKDNNPELSEAQRQSLIAAIHNARILDPACGSGAFVMGALESMVRLLRKVDPGNVCWKKQEERAINAIGFPEARDAARARFEKAFARDSGDYARKLYLIERCLHGVDIQPIAVQIAKLRIFISLAIEQEINRADPENYGIESLPNLETKIVAANTLRALEKPINLDIFTTEIQEKLRGKSLEYFTCYRRARKLQLEKDIEELLHELGDYIEKTDKKNKTDAALLRNWNRFDQNAFAPFFDREWMFGAAVQEGFDIVIGNPPYLRVQGIPEKDAALYKKKFQSAKGAFDLYALFIERGFGLLAPKGTLGFIVPHKFFQAAFGESLRKQLSDARALRQIVRFGHAQVFTEATTYTCLLFLSKTPQEKFDLIEIERLDHALELFKALRTKVEHPELARALFDAPKNTNWDFSLGESNKTLARLKQHPHTLGEITRKIFQGIATSADKLYVLEERRRFTDESGVEVVRCFSKVDDAEIEIEAALVKPFLMGKDVHRYEPPKVRNVVIFPYLLETQDEKPRATLMSQIWIKKNCPLGWKFLKRHEEALGERERGRMHGENFYAYIYPKNLTEFAAPKIMTPDIALGCQMTLDQSGALYHTTTIYSFVFNGTYETSEKFLLGLLNTKVLWFFLISSGNIQRGGYFRFKTDYLRPFPIPAAPDAIIQTLVERLVDYQLHLKSGACHSSLSLLMATGFDRLLDGLIYELYFPEEFEKRVMLSQTLTPESLPPLPLSDKALEAVFQSHFAPTADARAILFAMEEIEAVRVIEAAAPGRTQKGGEK